MVRCQRCGMEYRSDQVKRCPGNIYGWSGKFICERCYNELKNEKYRANDAYTQPSNNRRDIVGYNNYSSPSEKNNRNMSYNNQYKNYYQPLQPQFNLNIRKKGIIALILSIVVLSLLIFSIFLPWYSMTINIDGDMYYQGKTINLDGDIKSENFFTEVKTVTDYDITGDETESEDETDKSDYEDDDIKNTMNTTLILIIIDIVLAVISLIVMIIVSLSKISKKWGILVFSIMTILVFITMLFFTIAIPNNIGDNLNEQSSDALPNFMNDFDERYNEQFFGSTSYRIPWSDLPFVPSSVNGEITYKMSWGGGLGWFLIVTSLIFSILGLVIAVFVKER